MQSKSRGIKQKTTVHKLTPFKHGYLHNFFIFNTTNCKLILLHTGKRGLGDVKNQRLVNLFHARTQALHQRQLMSVSIPL